MTDEEDWLIIFINYSIYEINKFIYDYGIY